MKHDKKTTVDNLITTKPEKTLVQTNDAPSSQTFFTKISARLHDMLPNKTLDLNQLDNDEQRRAQLYLDTTRARYVDLYELAPVGYCTINSEGLIVQTNLFISTLLGLPRDKLFHRSIDQFILNDDLAIYNSLQKVLIETGESQSHQLRMVKADGTLTWVKMTVAAEKRGSEEQLFHFTLIDINEHKKAEESLRLASSVFTHTREGILVTDAEGNIIDVNAAFTRITQYNREEVIGKNTRFLKSGHHNDAFYQSLWSNLLAKGYWHGEIWNRKKDGEFYAEMKSINAVYDEHHNVINYVSLFKDITEKELHQTHLEHIAHFDALTSLPNRSLFIDRLRQGLTQTGRRESQLAVVFIDLDEFKAINDKHGHDAGDQVLITLSSRMRQTLREGDTLSRLGGDEFVALLLDLPDIEASLSMLSRLLLAASQPVQFGDNLLQVSASLGVTFYPQTIAKDAEQLLRQADQAMYYAKLAGKNNYHIFNEEQDDHMHSQHENLSRIENALNMNEFVLHYQPKVNMRTGQIIGVEASIYWENTSKEQPRPLLFDRPDRFLSVIKNHTLTISIGEWMLNSALNQIEHWQEQGINMPVSINISTFHLQQTNFIARLSAILLQHPKVDPSYLELEIVETHAQENVEQVFRVISDCRDLGISCALDNFGTGYSSMTYLRRLPISLLKIDASFTRYMLENSDALLVLEGAISLAHAFHLNILAEGVNSIDRGTMLMRLGCDLGQGNCIANSMPAEALQEWQRNWKVDPAWINVPRANHEDFPLILASVENNGWCRLVENYMSGMSETNPILDSKQRQLGTWLNGVGLKQYGTHAAFSKINDLYHQSLNIAKKLCANKEDGSDEDNESQLNSLYMLSEELSKQINLLLLR
jgi:diguanylate cyclase (GGDEF)-like protein/PAS domain S-box-containing protein